MIINIVIILILFRVCLIIKRFNVIDKDIYNNRGTQQIIYRKKTCKKIETFYWLIFFAEIICILFVLSPILEAIYDLIEYIDGYVSKYISLLATKTYNWFFKQHELIDEDEK